MKFQSRNPATDEPIESYEGHSTEQMNEIIDQVHETWLEWRRVPFAERAEPMRKAAEVLRSRKDEFARLMTAEMGKPMQQSPGEIEKCAWVCEFYADNAERFLAPREVETGASRSYVSYQPEGTVFAIMPWNFPFWQVFRFGAPALMAGNAGVLKHAPNVPGCALAIEEVFREAGFPENLFRTLLIDTDQASQVIANRKISAVTLTGSTRAGRSVAAQAGQYIKKTVLELGGSDPYVVLEDADLDLAVQTCCTSRLINSGQSCIGAKRFIVVESVADEFEKAMVERLSAATLGDPTDEDTVVGPLARPDLRDNLARQVKESVEKGATCLTGGEVPKGPGNFYPATVLSGVKPGMPAYDEEMFGPVASIIRVRDEAEALRVANDTAYGLGSAVFTRDLERGERIAREELQAGSGFVNAMVASDPRLPFGGIKESGYGRELSEEGIREFVNTKTVFIK